MDRRTFLSLATLLPLGRLAFAGETRGSSRYITGHSDHQGGHFASVLNGYGHILNDIPLPGRAHGAVVHPSGKEAMIVARSPGRFLQQITADNQAGLRLSCPDNRHFQGHVAYSQDGQRLYTTENNLDEPGGIIGVWDVEQGYRRIGEWSSHGIGPHELKRLPGSDILVIANGGVLTHPDSGSRKLNLDDMRSSLAYLNPDNGECLARHEAPQEWRRLSIRHFDIAANGLVAMGMQYYGPRNHRPPLVGLQQSSAAIAYLRTDRKTETQMRRYTGSVTFAEDGQTFAVSCPRGHLITVWDSRSGELLHRHNLKDGCGLADSEQGFMISGGRGDVVTLGDNYDIARQERYPQRAWDNHMRRWPGQV